MNTNAIPNDLNFNYVECRDIDILVAEMKKYIKNDKLIQEVKKAYFFAEQKHKGQKRKNGDPFIVHPLSTGYYLAQWRMGPKTIIAGLLHDIIEDTPVTFTELEKMYGNEVADIVEAVTKVSYFAKENRTQMKANYLRKLFLSMIRDIRVIIVKIADRMHNILTLSYMTLEKQKIIAKETLEIYASIAHRIGMKTAKNLLEDYSFKYLNPKEYERVKNLLEEDISTRKKLIANIIQEISEKLKEKKLKNFKVFGRSKTIYSIYRKLTLFGKTFNDINDILAVRIITNNKDECYQILGWLHQMFTPLSGRFKDYIATPKNNLYQSLHSILVNKVGVIFEVQIRTYEMDEIAENGAAAHWKYKEGEKNVSTADKQKEIDAKVDMFTRLINLEKIAVDSSNIDFKTNGEKIDIGGEVVEETIKTDYLTPTIYILTPDGSVINLPFGSTVLDFAYKLDTQIGHKTVGAKINGVFSPYNTILNSGEMVEIKTSKDTEPHEKWLYFVRTATARREIENYLNDKRFQEEEKEKITNQKIIRNTKREIDRYIIAQNLKWSVNSLEEIKNKIKMLDYKSIDEFLLSVGKGDFTIPEAVNIVYTAKDELKDIEVINDMKTRKYKSTKGRNDLRINGIEQVNCTLAQCCYPIPDEPIISFITKLKGIQVHRSECINVIKHNKSDILLKSEWIKENTCNKKYRVKVRINFYDRPGIILDIMNVFAIQRIDLSELKLVSNEDNCTAKGSMIININDVSQLKTIIKAISDIPGIIAVSRASVSD